MKVLTLTDQNVEHMMVRYVFGKHRPLSISNNERVLIYSNRVHYEHTRICKIFAMGE